ncbi:hypothetical protein N825_37170 [Skermanella stibiiresistens SB22]|uniref:EAL domain-containing protein n=1 Tax=Skermanella stibiiresistens SB22 TaxID=1385369 RepID=W9H6S7_9PROT|nr:hypothetical protein [Skermanella stibiiresistens]EWY40402.1 hypothetical protein N825_37170 [Skermanella stibiiresistens SB22]
MGTSELLDKIKVGVRDFLAEEQPAPAPRRQPSVVTPAREATEDPGQHSPAGFAIELAHILEHQPRAAAGRIHLIGLEPIRARLGDRWTMLQDNIHLLASKVIAQHLGAGDVFCRYGTLDYLIAFSSLTPVAARLKSVVIAQALYSHFLGDTDLDGVVIRTAVGQVDGSVVFEENSVNGLLTRFAQSLEPETSAQPIGLDAGSPSLASPSLASRIDWLYRPILDRRHAVISTWCCTPITRPTHGAFHERVQEGYATLGPDAGADQIAELDRLTLSRAFGDLTDLLANRFSVFINAPIHFESLGNSRTRIGIRDLLQKTSDQLRRFLVLEMYGVPDDISRVRLLEMAGMLRPFCRSVLLAADPRAHGIIHAKECGIHGVGFDLSGGIPGELDRVCRMLERGGVRVALTGIKTTAQAETAAAAGVTYLGGPRIGPPGEVPANMVRYDWNDLLAERCPL